MSEPGTPAATAREPALHPFEFRGTGKEFFGIWIVNIALTLVTLGIFSAWAKVRSRRYFYGNTFVAGHSFDYHAKPWRILVGRLIAVALFAGYTLSTSISPFFAIPWVIILAITVPWLVNASQRFNARNTSYRNVRFNFTATYWDAFKVMILWTLASVVTLGGLIPLAHRARDYFVINFHSYGGKHFHVSFPGWSIYKIYLQGLGIFIGGILAAVILVVGGVATGIATVPAPGARPGPVAIIVFVIAGVAFMAAYTVAIAYVGAKAVNLAVDNTSLDQRHRLGATLSPWMLTWIGLSNIVLILVTIGLYYPWARVRLSRYLASHMSLLASSNLDEFASEAFATQSAIGEEVAGFFGFDFGL